MSSVASLHRLGVRYRPCASGVPDLPLPRGTECPARGHSTCRVCTDLPRVHRLNTRDPPSHHRCFAGRAGGAARHGVSEIRLRSSRPAWTGLLPCPASRSGGRSGTSWGFEDRDFVVGHMGAFTSEKGQDVAVQAALLLRSRLPDLRMVLAGEGPLRSSLQANTFVRFPGPCFVPVEIPGGTGSVHHAFAFGKPGVWPRWRPWRTASPWWLPASGGCRR